MKSTSGPAGGSRGKSEQRRSERCFWKLADVSSPSVTTPLTDFSPFFFLLHRRVTLEQTVRRNDGAGVWSDGEVARARAGGGTSDETRSPRGNSLNRLGPSAGGRVMYLKRRRAH